MFFAVRDPAIGPLLGSFPAGAFPSSLAGGAGNRKARQWVPATTAIAERLHAGIGPGLLMGCLGSGISSGMPTILRSQGLAVRIYLNDHAPPHVHVASADGVAKIALGQPPGNRPRLVTATGMSRADVARALGLVAAHGDLCLARWREIHG